MSFRLYTLATLQRRTGSVPSLPRYMQGQIRQYGDKPQVPVPPTGTATRTSVRVERVLNRLPRFTQRYVAALRAAPFSHISAFLVLHELTAIVPLFGLAGVFHYSNWLPPGFVEAKWMIEGTRRFGNYMRQKGWITEEQKLEARTVVEEDVDQGKSEEEQLKKRAWFGLGRSTAKDDSSDLRSEEGLLKKTLGKVTDKGSRSTAWDRGEGGVRLVVEFATAYAIVKMIIIPRVIFSVWGTPWFARVVIEPLSRRTVQPLWTRLKALFGGGAKKPLNEAQSKQNRA